LNIHTLDGYDVRAQVIAIVRDHLKPGEFFKKRLEVSVGAFRRLARKVDFRTAVSSSKGRFARTKRRLGASEKWYDPEAQDWFLERVRELELQHGAPAPILLGRHLVEMGMQPGPRIGEITKAVYEMQLDGRFTSLDEAKQAAREMTSRG
jgi:tRNA nucleotidyltransferase (CCA-adding enzyme)